MKQQPIAEIFSQGEEVICGQIADTNAAWLSEHLFQMGFSVARHTAVGDQLSRLVELLIEISQRADICICTGGLGSTIDDLTAQAVSQAIQQPLQLDPVALIQVESYFTRRGRDMADSNRKQAYFPKGADRIDNALGSAPGFSIIFNRCWFVFLPGVPSEMRQMFNDEVKHHLFKRYQLMERPLFAIKTIGIGESDLQQKLQDIDLPESVELGFRATTEEVQTKLLFPAGTKQELIDSCINKVTQQLGQHVYVVDNLNKNTNNLVSIIDQLMRQENYRLSIIETASQGLIAAKCIGYEWVDRSCFVPMLSKFQSDWQQAESLDVEAVIAEIAVDLPKPQQSELVLVQLYQGSQHQFHQPNESIALYNVLLTDEDVISSQITISGPLQRKQNQAAIRALDFLRRYLLNPCH